jgi:uncharacterized protein
MTRFHTLFPQPRPIIGMISLPPLPGFPGFQSIDHLIAVALADLDALQAGGASGALVENDFDQPHTLTVGPEIVAAMTRVTREVVARAQIPIGVQVLLNDWRASLAIAATSGAQFARLDFFVDRVQIKAGLIEPEPDQVTAYRAQIGAAHIVLLTDLQVKYSTLVERGKPLAQSAHEAAQHAADALIITGPETAIGPARDDLVAAQSAGLPVLIGSGLTPANADLLMPHASGAIVGTYLRSGRGPEDRVVFQQVRQLIQQIERPRPDIQG